MTVEVDIVSSHYASMMSMSLAPNSFRHEVCSWHGFVPHDTVLDGHYDWVLPRSLNADSGHIYASLNEAPARSSLSLEIVHASHGMDVVTVISFAVRLCPRPRYIS